LASTSVSLSRAGSTWVADDFAGSSLNLNDMQSAGSEVSAAALRWISGRLINEINTAGYSGVLVVPDSSQIDPRSGDDLRSASDQTIRLIVWVSQVGQVRTIAKGTRFSSEAAINNAAHNRIAENSPLVGTGDGTNGALLDRRALDEYLRRLNRQPGRGVEAALSSTEVPGEVVLDFLVNETRPWFVYAQVSNTGTEAPSELRERVGIVHNQLFKRDDIASLDFITSNFQEANAVFASYSYPLLFPEKLRMRAYGSWGDYQATVPFPVGTNQVAVDPEKFSGDSYSGGIELVWNPLRLWGFDVDLIGGVSYHAMTVVNDTLKTEAEATLFTPYAAVKVARSNEFYGISGSVGVETNTGSELDEDLVSLGRLDVSNDYTLLKAEINAFVYLEPLFFGVSADNPWNRSTLAHEVAFNFRAQSELDGKRLIPQREMAVGGLFSVRGYPESTVAGDDAFFGSLEYRFHMPRAMRPKNISESNADGVMTEDPDSTLFGRPFNVRPPRMYGRPDWDLIFKTFVDFGGTGINNIQQTEKQYTLLSVGGGVELQLFRNLNFRADVGIPVEDVLTGITIGDEYVPGLNDSSSSRAHFLLTYVW
jgi:hemolysin activation/secretion protein